MRSLGQPKVLKAALVAAFASAIFCAPRLVLWHTRPYPLWYLEALLFLGGTVLWAFVFAWHTKYTQRPVFTFNIESRLRIIVTIAGIAAAASLHLTLDPILRTRTPEDYPATYLQWLAMTLFSLAFTQLFLLFAPFAWLMRLFRRTEIATVLTVLFGIVVLFIKNRSSANPLSLEMLIALLIVRVIGGLAAIYCYLRGGILLTWWWGLLLQSRHLLDLIG